MPLIFVTSCFKINTIWFPQINAIMVYNDGQCFLLKQEMARTHVVALFFWFVGSFGFMLGFAVTWTDWSTDRRVLVQFTISVHTLTVVGMFGILAVLWKDAIVSSLLNLRVGEPTAEDTAAHFIFASMRFVNGQPLPEALQLRDALQQRGAFLKIVELAPGADINEEVFQSIEEAEAFLVFGTANYGEKTSNPAYADCSIGTVNVRVLTVLLVWYTCTGVRTTRVSSHATLVRRSFCCA